MGFEGGYIEPSTGFDTGCSGFATSFFSEIKSIRCLLSTSCASQTPNVNSLSMEISRAIMVADSMC
eukprot:1174195-Rhodomonas_salina.1